MRDYSPKLFNPSFSQLELPKYSIFSQLIFEFCDKYSSISPNIGKTEFSRGWFFKKCPSICNWLCKCMIILPKLSLLLRQACQIYEIFSKLIFWKAWFFCFSLHKYFSEFDKSSLFSIMVAEIKQFLAIELWHKCNNILLKVVETCSIFFATACRTNVFLWLFFLQEHFFCC